MNVHKKVNKVLTTILISSIILYFGLLITEAYEIRQLTKDKLRLEIQLLKIEIELNEIELQKEY